jgi:amino acid transporter
VAGKEHGGRTIGPGGATIIGLGAIVGGGILALAGTAFGETGPSTLLAFLLNGVIALLTALAYAEMSSAFPENGGAYAFTKKVMTVQAAFGVGWILLFASIAAGVLYALGFSAYAVEATGALCVAFDVEPPDWLTGRGFSVFLAVASIGFYTAILSRKQGGTGKAETIGKIVVFGFLILFGLWRLLLDADDAVEGKLTPFFAGGPRGLFAAMGYTFIALQGFDIIAAVAGEVRDPKRTLPRAMVGSLGVALVIYLPLLFVIMTVGVPEGGSVAEMGRARPETMMAEAVGNYLGPVGFWMVMVAALLSMLSALFANLLAASRIAFAMATDRTLPRMLSKTSESTGIPVRAVLVSALLMAAILFVVPDVSSAGAAASLIFLISFGLTHLTNIMARRRMGADFTGFRAPWFPVLQTIGVVACGGLAIFQSLAVPEAGSIATVWLLIGFALYFTRLSEQATVVDARAEALDPELVRLRGREPLVLVPVANPRRARTMVELADALAPPQVGRVVLLSVLRASDDWEGDEIPQTLLQSQEVMRAAIPEAVRRRSTMGGLTTVSNELWGAIAGMANTYHAETLLLGLSDPSPDTVRLPLERVIDEVESDVVVLGCPEGWGLDAAQRILVLVGGESVHDQLRARVLGGLLRSSPRDVTYLRVVRASTPPDECRRMERALVHTGRDETAARPAAKVVADDDVLGVITAHAEQSDLVIVGTRRTRRGRAIGDVALRIARATRGGIVLISHHAPVTAAMPSAATALAALRRRREPSASPREEGG